MANPTSPTSTVTRKTLETVHKLLAETDLGTDAATSTDDGPTSAPPPPAAKLLPRRARGR